MHLSGCVPTRVTSVRRGSSGAYCVIWGGVVGGAGSGRRGPGIKKGMWR
jgi:hypothetical protein